MILNMMKMDLSRLYYENNDFDNWMPLENDSIRLLVRQTLSDWNMPGTIHIMN